MRTRFAVAVLLAAIVLALWAPWRSVSHPPERRVEVPVDVVLETD